TRLAQAALRQAALCVGRGAFTLGALRPLPTELLRIPPLNLSGRFPPQGGVQSLDPNHHKPELNVWAEFNNGVAAALQVSGPGAEVSRGWILHHRAQSAQGQATNDNQVSNNTHAGFLLGLGLRGCLKVLPVADCYKYLRLQHDTTSAAVILGLAASHVSSMDAGLTRTCCVHIPSMLPVTFSDVEVASPVQSSAVLSLGLLFAGSAHRMMTELLVA
ncbi:ANAPC1, partial [Symbiodinium sp. CCMP2592]